MELYSSQQEERFLEYFDKKVTHDLNSIITQITVQQDLSNYVDSVLELFIFKCNDRLNEVLEYFNHYPPKEKEVFSKKLFLLIDYKCSVFKKEFLG